jgi:hypothetical protein
MDMTDYLAEQWNVGLWAEEKGEPGAASVSFMNAAITQVQMARFYLAAGDEHAAGRTFAGAASDFEHAVALRRGIAGLHEDASRERVLAAAKDARTWSLHFLGHSPSALGQEAPSSREETAEKLTSWRLPYGLEFPSTVHRFSSSVPAEKQEQAFEQYSKGTFALVGREDANTGYPGSEARQAQERILKSKSSLNLFISNQLAAGEGNPVFPDQASEGFLNGAIAQVQLARFHAAAGDLRLAGETLAQAATNFEHVVELRRNMPEPQDAYVLDSIVKVAKQARSWSSNLLDHQAKGTADRPRISPVG